MHYYRLTTAGDHKMHIEHRYIGNSITIVLDTFSVSSIDKNFLLSPTNIQLLTQGKCSFTTSSMGTGATFSPPAVIKISENQSTVNQTLEKQTKKRQDGRQNFTYC
jgi:hypothetical protein